jgi:hypothetical protein|tara:strand:+ start:409 stop:708 length:300 start_codon:yes stop_codon:yes gene_type:complete
MLVKDLKVGAMYRIREESAGHFFSYSHTAETVVFIGHSPRNENIYGRKMVYLGTRMVGYKVDQWHRRHNNNTQRLGLFGDKVMAIDPFMWKHIEPMEEE